MASSPAKKLRIRDHDILLTLHAPADFKRNLGKLPVGVKILTSGKEYGQIHWFVMSKALLYKELPRIMKLLQQDTLCWIYYPKGSSKIQTDLTRDKGWDELLKEDLQWLTLLSFDDTWSAFSFRRKKAGDEKKAVSTAGRPVLEYVDPVKKTVRLPEDLSAVLVKDKKAEVFFQSLSFTNKKEYIEWILTAKRTATREDRVKGSLERLRKGWKNPRNL